LPLRGVISVEQKQTADAARKRRDAVTRLSDRADPVPDDIWEETSRRYAEEALAPRSGLTAIEVAGSNPAAPMTRSPLHQRDYARLSSAWA
jgi:hypothetical protein